MPLNSAEQCFSYLESFTNLERKISHYEREYRLDRVKYLFARFGSPHEKINLIHVAGSKGKGSTSAYAASVLSQAGLRTGLYSSPHLSDYRERITLSGQFFPDHVYISETEKIRDFLKNSKLPFESPPTTFELLTLLAFNIFVSQKCGWAVIETGIGGRLDATNIITPVCSVITPLELEHTDILGTTIEEIAAEKSGIIKQGVPVVSAAQKPEAAAVIKSAARRQGAGLDFMPFAAEPEDIEVSLKGTTFNLKILTPEKKYLELRNLGTSMIGKFQAENASLAAAAVMKALEEKGIYPRESDFAEILLKGIGKTSIPGRMEYIERNDKLPAVILDSSHTPYSVSRFTETVRQIAGIERIAVIYGSVEGKDFRKMTEILASSFNVIIVSTPGNFKKNDPKMIYNYLKEVSGPDVSLIFKPDPYDALACAALEAGAEGLIVVTGSFYMAGEIKKIIDGGFCGISA